MTSKKSILKMIFEYLVEVEMWTLVYMAQNKAVIDKLCSIFGENDIIFRNKVIAQEANDDGIIYEILVPDAEVAVAQEIIFDTEIE